jgi:hypothetical protein
MTTIETHTPYTNQDVAALAEKLATWKRALTPREQDILADLGAAVAAADRGDVEGYRLNAMGPREPTGPTPIGSPTTIGTVVAVLGGAGAATPYLGAAIDSAIAGVIADPLRLLRP